MRYIFAPCILDSFVELSLYAFQVREISPTFVLLTHLCLLPSSSPSPAQLGTELVIFSFDQATQHH